MITEQLGNWLRNENQLKPWKHSHTTSTIYWSIFHTKSTEIWFNWNLIYTSNIIPHTLQHFLTWTINSSLSRCIFYQSISQWWFQRCGSWQWSRVNGPHRSVFSFCSVSTIRDVDQHPLLPIHPDLDWENWLYCQPYWDHKITPAIHQHHWIFANLTPGSVPPIEVTSANALIY